MGRDVLVEAELEVRDVAEQLRRLMFELLPPVGRSDLSASVEAYCGVLFACTAITYEIDGDTEGLGPDRYLVAYRLIQEVLRNALTHSCGTRVRVSFETVQHELVARVADDGVGMGRSELAPTHAGLRIVRQRAEAAGCSASFGVGLDGRGSSIELRIPLGGGPGR